MKDMDKQLGYSFSVDGETVVNLDNRLLMGTHDYFLNLSMNQEFKNPFVLQKYKLCKKEIERRLFNYDILIKRADKL